jgi:YVTN family beta-propeller protein
MMWVAGRSNARFRWVLRVVVFGLAGALVGVVPDGLSAVAGRGRCRATAFVTNAGSDSVSTIDVKTRDQAPTDIEVGEAPGVLAITPCRR